MKEVSYYKEVLFAAHVGQGPKLCLGEMHVPKDFLFMREKTLPVVVKIRYARH
jgi:hypothetical protein